MTTDKIVVLVLAAAAATLLWWLGSWLVKQGDKTAMVLGWLVRICGLVLWAVVLFGAAATIWVHHL